MNPDKQHAKLIKYAEKAETCLTRDKAQKILRKVHKTAHKLEMHRQKTDDHSASNVGSSDVHPWDN